MNRRLVSPPWQLAYCNAWRAHGLEINEQLKAFQGHLEKLSKHGALCMAHLAQCSCAGFCHPGRYKCARLYVFVASSFSLGHCSVDFLTMFFLSFYVCSCCPQWDRSFLGHQTIKLGWQWSVWRQLDRDNLPPGPGHIYVSISTIDLYKPEYLFLNYSLHDEQWPLIGVALSFVGSFAEDCQLYHCLGLFQGTLDLCPNYCTTLVCNFFSVVV